jgi:hypothetical protein
VNLYGTKSLRNRRGDQLPAAVERYVHDRVRALREAVGSQAVLSALRRTYGREDGRLITVVMWPTEAPTKRRVRQERRRATAATARMIRDAGRDVQRERARRHAGGR